MLHGFSAAWATRAWAVEGGGPGHRIPSTTTQTVLARHAHVRMRACCMPTCMGRGLLAQKAADSQRMRLVVMHAFAIVRWDAGCSHAWTLDTHPHIDEVVEAVEVREGNRSDR